MLRSNNIYNPINNKFVYFDKYKTFHQHEEMGLIPNDSIVFVGEGLTTTDGPFIWTHGKIFGAAGIIEYIHNFVNNNATSINAALAEQLAQLKALIDAEHKSITDDANAALDKVKQDLEAAEEKIKWLQEHGSDEDKIEHLMAILYDEIGKVNADLVEYNKKISAINGIIEETFAKYDIDGKIKDEYNKVIDLVKGYVQEELRKVNLDERIVQVVGRYMESGLLKDYVTYALLSDEKTITSFAEQLLKANETFASLEDLVSWRSGDGLDLIETLAALKLYVDGLKSSWLLSAEYKGLNDFVAAILGYADENESFIDMVASRITTTVGQFLFKITGTKTCILIDENGIRHFIDVNGNGEWDGEPTEHSNFFLGTDGSGWLGALKDGIRPIVWDSDGNVKIQKEEIWDGDEPFNWESSSSYKTEYRFAIVNNNAIPSRLENLVPESKNVTNGEITVTYTINDATYTVKWLKNAIGGARDQSIFMILRENKVDKDGKWITDGYGQWQGPYQISGADGSIGVDSAGIHFIYKATPTKSCVLPAGITSVNLSEGWVESASEAEIDGTNKRYSWMAFSTQQNSSHVWINFQGPILWSVWGDTGIDGDGIEYIFYVTNDDVDWNDTTHPNPQNWQISQTEEYIEDSNWKDDPQNMSEGDYQWASKRTYSWAKLWTLTDENENPLHKKGTADKSAGKKWGAYSKPQLWSHYAKDGRADGYTVDLNNSSLAVTVDDNGLLSLGQTDDFTYNVIVNVNKIGANPVPYTNGMDLANASAEAPIYKVEAGATALEVAASNSDSPGSNPNYWYYSENSADGRGIDVTIVSADKILANPSNYIGSNGSSFINEAAARSEINLKKHRVRFDINITIYDSYTSSTVYHAYTYTRSFYVYGVYTGSNGQPGYTLDLKCSSKTVHVAKTTGERNPRSISVWCLKTRGNDNPQIIRPANAAANDLKIGYKTSEIQDVYSLSLSDLSAYISSITYLTSNDSVDVSDVGDLCFYLFANVEGTWQVIDALNVSFVYDGDPGEGSYVSTIFCRTSIDKLEHVPDTPTGGNYDTGRPALMGVTYNNGTPVLPMDPNTGLFIGGGSQVQWSGDIPEGEETLWESRCTFKSLIPNVADWTTPRKVLDTSDKDIQISTLEDIGENPNPAEDDGWYDPSAYTGEWKDVIWLAERWKTNGIWGEWLIFRIKGEKGDGRFTSTIFTRCNVEDGYVVDAPNYDNVNGIDRDNSSTYEHPVPQNDNNKVTASNGTDTQTKSGILWHDGIPEGEELLWGCTGIFEQGVVGTIWKTPLPMTDTEIWDVEFSFEDEDMTQTPPVYDKLGDVINQSYNAYGPDTTTRTRNSDIKWFDTKLDNSDTLPSGKEWKDAVWRAERSKKNGVWDENWTIIRIKGEKGPSGDGYNLTAGGFEGSTLYINYDNLGRKEDGNITIPVQFHFGGTLIPNDLWDLECSSTLDGTGYITYNNDNTITVSGVPADGTHSITITATIESQEYGNDTLTVVIQVARKLNSHYEVRVSPWFITLNTTTHKFGEAGNASTQTVDVQVIRLLDLQAQQIGSGGSKWTITPSYNLDKSTDSATKSTYLLNASNSYPNTIKFTASPNDSNASIEGTLTIQANADGNTPNPPDPNIDYKLVVDGSATYNISTKNLSFNISAWHVHKNDGNVWSEYASNNDSKGISVEYKASDSEFNTLTIGSYNEYPDNVPGSILFIAKYNGNVISYCYMPVSIIAEGAEINYDTLAEKVGDLGKLFVMQGEFDPTLQYTIQNGYTPLVYFHEQGQEYGYWWELILSNTETDTTQTPSKTYRYAPGEYPTSYTAVSNTDSGRGLVVDYVGRKFDWRGVRSGTNPKFTYTNNYWRKVDRFNTIITDAIFADFAKFGSAIISGDYMFSKWGKIGNITYNNDNGYLKFNPHLSLIDSSTATLLYEPLERTYSGEKSDFGNLLPIDIFVGVKDQSCLIQITEEDVVLHQTPGQHANIGLGLSLTDFVSISTGENLNADKFDKYRGKMCHLYIYRSSSNITDRTVYLKITELTLTSTDVFKPNWCVDLKTGKMIAGGGNFVVEPDGAINVGRGNFTVSKQGDVEMVGTLTSGSTITGATILGNSIIGGTITGGTFLGIKNDLVILKYSPQSGSNITIDDTTDYYIHFSNATVSDSSIIFLPNPEDSANKMITIINPLNKTINLGIDNGSGVIDDTKQIGSYCNYTAGSNHTHDEKRIVLWCDPNPNLNAPAAQQRNCWTTIEETN